ncbi:hypothetical protein [Planomonospora venezuelensis]|uniref:Uncharacterized protein n=1 Tax=Planomonospora venezuelensis TaxID=1999 RepID=A0A841D4S4_PLAVE|nr:hypothetical protein [Planomonospora venezuelensis]MBB5964469.1 hypothetical protein [Planomonospora venezuelensis]GIN04204.1 hypothetical protein Pve01_58620 [Planomonospora venezuelensis]
MAGFPEDDRRSGVVPERTSTPVAGGRGGEDPSGRSPAVRPAGQAHRHCPSSKALPGGVDVESSVA